MIGNKITGVLSADTEMGVRGLGGWGCFEERKYVDTRCKWVFVQTKY